MEEQKEGLKKGTEPSIMPVNNLISRNDRIGYQDVAEKLTKQANSVHTICRSIYM